MAEEHAEWQGEPGLEGGPPKPLIRRFDVERQRTRTLLDRVEDICGLSGDSGARAVIEVLNVLERRISGGEARRLEAELPREVREWMMESEKATTDIAEKFGRSNFFQAVEDRLRLDGQHAGPVVAGVFAAVREQIAERVARDIANQLPEELKVLWDHPVPDVRAPDLEGVEHRKRRPVSEELRAKRRESRQTNTYLDFIRTLSTRSGLNLEEAEDAAASVLCLLDQRLTREEASDMNAQLPMKLRELLLRCERHPGKPLRFDKWGMYEMVGEDLTIEPASAEPIVQSVFAAVKDKISAGEAGDVASQLPDDIAEVWAQA